MGNKNIVLLSLAVFGVRRRRWGEHKQVFAHACVTFPFVLYTEKSALTNRETLKLNQA